MLGQVGDQNIGFSSFFLNFNFKKLCSLKMLASLL